MTSSLKKLRRLSNSFIAPKLKLVTLLLKDIFASVMSLHDLNDFRIIEARSLIAGREHAVRKLESNHRFKSYSQNSSSVPAKGE